MGERVETGDQPRALVAADDDRGDAEAPLGRPRSQLALRIVPALHAPAILRLPVATLVAALL